ncbi:DUF1905 domain-containing protein [Litorihabitans aurantiacus]|uniref:DUF1905 domain-containing protein n=1 Tax=Litorihabitans aurantiacus TaxID=1930061 RepID=A0AA37XEP5_9MICO|nr:DUF1905 domain-containing protein [Litorihabitans aurantiacus]GMA31926.1 hypothetical protein GCM10025875_19180 [Litorihabitans aurantiacus]
MPYRFDAELWTMNEGRWHMLTVPEAASDEIDQRTAGLQGGFGSVKVEVTIGTSTWTTSVFPSREHGAYILPVKKAVRTAQGCAAGDTVDVTLRIVGLET